MELLKKKFREININDEFFNSLKSSYLEFSDWFVRKSDETAYVFEKDDGSIQGFLYLKKEDGAIQDVSPTLPPKVRIKVGTMKINAHGTKMGERFIKKIFDHAVYSNAVEVYVTVFEEHESLIRLLSKYGFETIGEKETHNGIEKVLLKSLETDFLDIHSSYPRLDISTGNCYLLSLYPKWHTRLLPDSILNNEHSNIVQDISSTNSIHKVYLCSMKGVDILKPGDTLLIYRTSDGKGPAHYRSVATSIGVVEDYRNINSFTSKEEFMKYCRAHSVFSISELNSFWERKNYPHVFKFTYNIAFKKRVTRGILINEVGLIAEQYWGFFQITTEQLLSIARKGEVDEGLIIH